MKKKMTYHEMLELLKGHTYSAPDKWSELSDQLDIQSQVTNLPTYNAPDNLWDGIAEALDEEKHSIDLPTQGKSTTYLKWAVMIILLLLMTIAYLLWTRPAPTSEYEYRSEKELVTAAEYADHEEIEIDGNLTEVYMYIKANEYMFSKADLEKFQKHLEELRTAIEAIQTMKENYGQDESVNRLLARIERDKSKLLKEMIEATT